MEAVVNIGAPLVIKWHRFGAHIPNREPFECIRVEFEFAQIVGENQQTT